MTTGCRRNRYQSKGLGLAVLVHLARFTWPISAEDLGGRRPRGCSRTAGSPTPRSRERGAPTASSPEGGAVPVLHVRGRASPTSVGCTWRRRRTRSCSVSIREVPDADPGPHGLLRPCWKDGSSAGRTTTTATAPRPCSPRSTSPPAHRCAQAIGTATKSSSRSPTQIERTHRHALDVTSATWSSRHLVMDNTPPTSTRTPRVARGQPTGPLHRHAWMNLVEFMVCDSRAPLAIRRGVIKTVKDLNTKIRAFIDGWNHHALSFGPEDCRRYPQGRHRPTTSKSSAPVTTRCGKNPLPTSWAMKWPHWPPAITRGRARP